MKSDKVGRVVGLGPMHRFHPLLKTISEIINPCINIGSKLRVWKKMRMHTIEQLNSSPEWMSEGESNHKLKRKTTKLWEQKSSSLWKALRKWIGFSKKRSKPKGMRSKKGFLTGKTKVKLGSNGGKNQIYLFRKYKASGKGFKISRTMSGLATLRKTRKSLFVKVTGKFIQKVLFCMY